MVLRNHSSDLMLTEVPPCPHVRSKEMLSSANKLIEIKEAMNSCLNDYRWIL